MLNILFFTIVNTECRLSKTNDNDFLDNLMESKVGNHEHFVGWKKGPRGGKSPSPRTINKSGNLSNSTKLNKSQGISSEKQLKTGEFKILHYAGEVVYKVEGFLQKNKDTLIPDCVSAIQKSKNPLIKELFPLNSTQMHQAKRKKKSS